MKIKYSLRLKSYLADFGSERVVIEERIKLNTFDLLYYPNMHRCQGKAKYVGVVKVRRSDLFELIGLLHKIDSSDEPISRIIHRHTVSPAL